MMVDRREHTRRIRALTESLGSDRAERDRLKQRADESLERFHHAVRELVGQDERERSAPSS